MTNTKTEIERLARVLAENIGPPFGQLHKNKRDWIEKRGIFDGESRDVNGPFQDDCLEAVRAILQALREPSEGMIEAGACELGDGFVHEDDRFWAKKTFTTMIKHILEEGESE